MPTHTATIRTVDRDPTRRDGMPCRLVTLTLSEIEGPPIQDHNPAPSHRPFLQSVVISYRQAAQLGFWLKPGQT